MTRINCVPVREIKEFVKDPAHTVDPWWLNSH